MKLILSFFWVFASSLCISPWLLFKSKRVELLTRLLRGWAWGVLRISGIKVVVEGAKIPNDRPVILMANHQSAFDVILFSQLSPRRATFVGKREIQRIPFLGWLLEKAGAILIDRTDRASSISQLSHAIERIRQDRLAVAYAPEGTRNLGGRGLLHFKKGGFHLALEGGFPIVPIVASPIEGCVSFRHRRFGPGRIRLRVLELQEPARFSDADSFSGSVREVMELALKEISA